MIDFLRANPWCSQNEYKWQMSVAQVRLSSFDFSHVEYPKTKRGDKGKKESSSLKNAQKINSAKDMLNDLGVPIIKEK